MKLVAIESATAAAAVALAIDGDVIAEVVTTQDRHHAETIIPALVEIMTEASLSLDELDGIVVDRGPGLFTGLRVGVATARSLAAASGLGLEAVTSLEVLAADPAVAGASTVVAAVNARRGEVFIQRFRNDPEGPHPLAEPRVATPSALVDELIAARADGGAVALVGDGAHRYAELLDDEGRASLAGQVVMPRPSVAASLVERRGLERHAPAEVVPLYLRDPDAVANFKVAEGMPRR